MGTIRHSQRRPAWAAAGSCRPRRVDAGPGGNLSLWASRRPRKYRWYRLFGGWRPDRGSGNAVGVFGQGPCRRRPSLLAIKPGQIGDNTILTGPGGKVRPDKLARNPGSIAIDDAGRVKPTKHQPGQGRAPTDESAAGRGRVGRGPAADYPNSASIASPKTAVWRSTSSTVVAGDISAML
jgi:hypothetical protein